MTALRVPASAVVPRVLTLADGTQIIAQPGALVVPARTQVGLHFEVLRGEAAFAVAPRPADEPFLVSAHEVEVRVVGTRFVVWRMGDEVSVAVEEGRVKVSGPEHTHALSAGARWTAAPPAQARPSAAAAPPRPPGRGDPPMGALSAALLLWVTATPARFVIEPPGCPPGWFDAVALEDMLQADTSTTTRAYVAVLVGDCDAKDDLHFGVLRPGSAPEAGEVSLRGLPDGLRLRTLALSIAERLVAHPLEAPPRAPLRAVRPPEPEPEARRWGLTARAQVLGGLSRGEPLAGAWGGAANSTCCPMCTWPVGLQAATARRSSAGGLARLTTVEGPLAALANHRRALPRRAGCPSSLPARRERQRRGRGGRQRVRAIARGRARASLVTAQRPVKNKTIAAMMSKTEITAKVIFTADQGRSPCTSPVRALTKKRYGLSPYR